jgi:2-octaprenyl-6-methoxyphenol hydroxylase
MPVEPKQRKPCCLQFEGIRQRVEAPVADFVVSAHLSGMDPGKDDQFDVAVVGGGAVGLAAALVAEVGGFRTAAFAPPSSFPPGRTALVLAGAIELLTELDVWPALSRHAAPLRAIRIVDSTRRLIRAPEVTFYASEIGIPAFGYNIPNSHLVDALRRHAGAFAGLTLISAPAEAVNPTDRSVSILGGGRLVSASLVVAADGARSLAREAAGIRATRWSYAQSALVTTLSIQHPHQGVSTEYHTEAGPFTIVPLPGNLVSLVWVDKPQVLEAALALSETELSLRIEKQAHSIHGAMQVESRPAVFPLSAALAERLAANRTMLAGEAAHLFPPIGAQGLNLGFRDVAALRRVLSFHRTDPGAPLALDAYHRARQADVRSRTLAVDLLNRSLMSDFLPVQAARGLGLALAASVPLIRHTLMRKGMAVRR